MLVKLAWRLRLPACTPCPPVTTTRRTRLPPESALPVISAASVACWGVEYIALPVMVTDLNALPAAHNDGVLPRPRARLIHEAHQRLRRRHQVRVTVGPGLAQLRRKWSAPDPGRLLMLGEHQLGIRLAAEPLGHQSLQRGVGVLHRR